MSSSWVRTDVGIVDLDKIVQIGAELGFGNLGYQLIGWTTTGERFSIQPPRDAGTKFSSHADAIDFALELVTDQKLVNALNARTRRG